MLVTIVARKIHLESVKGCSQARCHAGNTTRYASVRIKSGTLRQAYAARAPAAELIIELTWVVARLPGVYKANACLTNHRRW